MREGSVAEVCNEEKKKLANSLVPKVVPFKNVKKERSAAFPLGFSDTASVDIIRCH